MTGDHIKKINQPMDLGVIKLKLDRKKYKAMAEFNDDLVLLFRNAFTCFENTSDEYEVMKFQ